MARRVLLEVCVETVEDALAAAAGGADRLELNGGLALGGLTPSAGLFAEVIAAVPLPVVAMVRPRPGGFSYDLRDFDVMVRDAAAFIAGGAAGLAFGVLTEAGEIDEPRCRILVEVCGDRDAVFHRAFDFTPDPAAALETLIGLGVRRVLTSGQAASAAAGAPLLADLVRQARGRIEVLLAGGIRPANAAELVARTGCVQIHGSFRTTVEDAVFAARPEVRLGVAGDGWDRTDGRLVAAVRTALDR